MNAHYEKEAVLEYGIFCTACGGGISPKKGHRIEAVVEEGGNSIRQVWHCCERCYRKFEERIKDFFKVRDPN